MIKLIVNAGAYVLEFSDTDLDEISSHLEKCKEKLPGFSLENYGGKGGKSEFKTSVAGKEDMVRWMRAQLPEHHSLWHIEGHSGFAKPRPLLNRMVKAGDIVLAQTAYVDLKSGNTRYMDACYLPGDELPEPWAQSGAEDCEIVLAWIEMNPAYVPKNVEKNCGVPPKQAYKALNHLLHSKQVIVKKDPKDGKGRVYLAQDLSEQTET